MTLTLPDVPALAALGEEQLLLELACAMYASRQVSRHVAAEIASMEDEQFEVELARRSISNGYQPVDLEADLRSLDRLLGSC